MGDPASFWNKRADKYAQQAIRDPAAYEQTLERVRAHLEPSDRALEWGCGTGSTALLLAPSVQSLVASDIAPRMVEIGAEKAQAEGVDNVRFVCGTAADFDPKEQRFDVVMGFNFLHLLDDIPSVVRQAFALLKPGGRFISKSVCLGEGSPLWRIAIAVMKPLGLAPHVEIMTAARLEAMIREAGFEIVETGDFPVKPRSHFVVARKP